MKYKCPDCPKEFNSPRALGPHRAKVHGYVAKPPSPNAGASHVTKRLAGSFPCPHCEFVASWQGGLAKHMRAKHPEQEQLPKPPKKVPHTSGPYKCPDCERSFSASTGLGIHRRNAHGVDGSSPTSVYQRKQRSELVKGTQDAALSITATTTTTNGHIQVPAQTDDGAHRLEAIATLACGRIQQVIEGLAFTHDLPPRSLTALVIRTLGQAAKVW